MASIRKNDMVAVRTGKDRGKRGRVIRVLADKNRVIVEGVNMIKRHTRPNPQKNIKGGIVEREASDPRVERDAARPGHERADAPRHEDAARRASGAHQPQERHGGGQMKDKKHSRLRERYQSDVVPALQKEFGYKNVNAVPKITKVVVNMGLGEATQNAKIIDTGAEELARITGQKAAVRRAKKSIAQFKVRQGMPIGAMVTLRGERMYEFLDRLMNISLPRVRDFRGVSPKGFDGRGNFTLGLRDQLIFVEIDYLEGRQVARHEHLGRDDGKDRRGSAQAAAVARHAVPTGVGQRARAQGLGRRD